jgi:hypothetical protein
VRSNRSPITCSLASHSAPTSLEEDNHAHAY